MCVSTDTQLCVLGDYHIPPELQSPLHTACVWQGCSYIPAAGVREVWFVSVDKTRWKAIGPLGRHLFVQVLR